MLRDETGQVSGRTERATVDLGQPEEGVVTGDDDVAVADETDTAPHAETGDGRDHGNRAVVHGGEGGEAALVGADEGIETFGVLHFLDVDAGVEATPLGA